MSLSDLRVLFVDCQTTGMRPPAASLLEIAWSPDGDTVHSHLAQLPEGMELSRRISEITGITVADLNVARPAAELAENFRQALVGVQALVIHYAQFEKPFLTELLGDEPALPVLCTYQLTKRALPNLPSRNIRATAGFFGPAVVGHNRAGTFVRATAQIWRGLCAELAGQNLNDMDALTAWLTDGPRTKMTRYEYRLDKAKRLKLPETPGVYRMLGKTGEVLYVGKATSLRDRVNSYFRGKKGRDQRKLEMLAQVWDLKVTPCPTPLEAALLESDEIKRLNPPYNVVLKTGRRHLVFYTRDFDDRAREQTSQFYIGPFRNSNWIEHLRLLARSTTSDRFEQIFFNPLPEDDLRAGFALFLERHRLAPLTTVRAFLAYGVHLYRHYEEPEVDDESAESDQEGQVTEIEPVVTVEDIADKFERLLRRSGAEYWRARKLTRLLNARVQVGNRRLEFRRGRMNVGTISADTNTNFELPWAGLDVDTFDRMSILLAEVERHGYSIEPSATVSEGP